MIRRVFDYDIKKFVTTVESFSQDARRIYNAQIIIEVSLATHKVCDLSIIAIHQVFERIQYRLGDIIDIQRISFMKVGDGKHNLFRYGDLSHRPIPPYGILNLYHPLFSSFASTCLLRDRGTIYDELEFQAAPLLTATQRLTERRAVRMGVHVNPQHLELAVLKRPEVQIVHHQRLAVRGLAFEMERGD